jgi:hypothetical protein
VTLALVSGNTDTGLMAGASKLAITASVVRDTEPDSSGHWGAGLLCLAKAECDVAATVFSGNTTAGAGVADYETALLLSHVVVKGTGPGSGLTGTHFGDGFLAIESATMDAGTCLLADNSRAGAFYDHARGTFEGNALSGNTRACPTRV